MEKTEKQIFNYLVKTALFLVILMVLSGDLKILLGYLFGLVIGILMFFHISASAKKALGMSKDKVKIFRVGQYILRYLIYGLTLWAAYTGKYLNFAGTVIGLLTIKIGLIVWALSRVARSFYESKFQSFKKF